MIGLDLLLSAPLFVPTSAFNVHSGCPAVQNIRAAATGERRTSAPTRRAATFNSETTEADDHRPTLLALAEAGFERLEILSDHRQARDGRRLASEGLSSVLAMEEP